MKSFNFFYHLSLMRYNVDGTVVAGEAGTATTNLNWYRQNAAEEVVDRSLDTSEVEVRLCGWITVGFCRLVFRTFNVLLQALPSAWAAVVLDFDAPGS